MMPEPVQHDKIDWSVTTWEGSRREQIERWSRMSLDEILDAQEQMAELAAEFSRPGLTPEPFTLDGLHTGSLGNYLAALGLLRAMAGIEGNGEIRGCWKYDRFILYVPVSTFDREALCRYLLQWKPATPFKRWWNKAGRQQEGC
jgi:hypothetical protein